MTPMPCSVRCCCAALPPGPACGKPGASGVNDVGGRLGTAAWARPPRATPLQDAWAEPVAQPRLRADRKSTRLNSSHLVISYAVFCLKKKKHNTHNRIES